MPRRPDTPCSVCGRLLWSGTTSSPAGQRVCRACRRQRREEAQAEREALLAGRTCPTCGAWFEPRSVTQVYCRPKHRPSRSATAKPKPLGDPRRTRAWRKLRDQVIYEEPICRLRLPGCTTLSQTADHIETVRDRPDLALVRANLRGACFHCNRQRDTTPDHQLPRLRARLEQRFEDTTAPALEWFA